MKLLRPSIFLATMVFVLAGAATTVADILANTANLLQQAIDSQQPLVAVLDGRIDRFPIEPTPPPMSERVPLKWARDQAVMAEAMPRSKTTKPRTRLQSRRENQDGRVMISQRDADITSSAPVISVATSADGGSVVQGDALTVSWQTSNAPA